MNYIIKGFLNNIKLISLTCENLTKVRDKGKREYLDVLRLFNEKVDIVIIIDRKIIIYLECKDPTEDLKKY